MKMKRFLTAAAVFLAAAALFAIEIQEEQIMLPDVTTTVSGETLTAGKNAIPDFNLVLPSSDMETSLLPQLPAPASTEVKENTLEEETVTVQEKAIYAEGLFGGGYPGFFTGDFTVYKSSTQEPFKIRFMHDTVNGFGSHLAADGFFTGDTELSGSKQFNLNQIVLDVSGNYSTESEGLQSKSAQFFDITKQRLFTSAGALWNFSPELTVDFKTDFTYYKHYAGVISSGNSFSAASGFGSVKPKLTVEYSNVDEETGGFEFCFDSEGVFEGIAQEVFDFESFINRGQFSLAGSWKNHFLSLGADAALVVEGGTSEGFENMLLPSFSLSSEIKLISSLSVRTMSVSLSGGLSSYLPDCAEYEKKYRYAVFSYLPSEVSDWYADLKVTVPVASSLTFETGINFCTSAFENGIWEPQYESESVHGVYEFNRINRTELNSLFKVSYLFGLFSVSADWNAHWLYCPALEAAQSAGLTFDLQSPEGSWGINVSVLEAFGSDLIPVVNAACFVKLNTSLRLGLELKDAVKLFTGSDRFYGNSIYISDSGSLSLLIKFFF